MTIRGKIKFKDAIIVDEKLLRELEEIILSFYDKIEYSCRLCNDNTIEFASLAELLDYENTKIRKIERLKISFGAYNEIVFEPSLSFWCSYKCTVEGAFITEDNDKGILFSDKIEKALDKNRQSKWYTILTKISLAHFGMLCFAMSLVSSMDIVITKGLNSQYLSYNPIFINFGFVIGIIFILFGIMLSKCRNVLLPPIAYKIGEQIKEIERGRDIFSKIVWGIIIAFIVSLLAGRMF